MKEILQLMQEEKKITKYGMNINLLKVQLEELKNEKVKIDKNKAPPR